MRDRHGRAFTPSRIATAALAAVFLLASAFASADAGYNRKYEVTITNLTPGQTFTPQLVATHSAKVSLFELGQPASHALEVLAEGGDTAPLMEELLASPYEVADVQTVPGLLGPGQSVTVIVEANRFQRYLSLAAMLIPTNDAFVALDSVALPRDRRSVNALAYDAGTEANDQNCLSIPGPRCGGEGHSPGPNESDEGFVHVSNGFHSLPAADVAEVLGPQLYDWRNPVARVEVKRIR
jgi:hypothetical protein